MPRAFLQRSRLRLLTVAAWSGLRPAPASRFRGADPHLPRSCTTPVYLMLPPFCVSLQHTEAYEVIDAVAKTVAELTSQQDGAIRQQVIEQLMHQIMHYDGEFRREEV